MSGESNIDKSQYVLPLDQPVVSVEAAKAFTALTTKQRLYAYHLSQACWTGSLITFVQTSPESPSIFVLLHKLFSAISPSRLRAAALEASIPDEAVTAFFVYSAAVFSNAGNYKVSAFVCMYGISLQLNIHTYVSQSLSTMMCRLYCFSLT